MTTSSPTGGSYLTHEVVPSDFAVFILSEFLKVVSLNKGEKND